MSDPALCTEETTALLAMGTGDLTVDSVAVGNVAILDAAGEGDNIPIFKPAVTVGSDTNQYQLGFQRRIVIEATCDGFTLANLELLLKEPGAAIAGGGRIALTTIREETLHEVQFVHTFSACPGADDCTALSVLFRRAFVELPWTLPFRRDAFAEYVLRFVALPDAAFPMSPFGYVDLLCPAAES